MSLISVIVPVYKVEKYLHRCVDSILDQTFDDFELILVDDGSPDNCGVICDEYAQKDNRVHVIHQKNGGLSAARNAGLEWMYANSSSQWISFIDSDDWVHEKYLELLYDTVVQTSTEISVCGYKETYDEDLEVFDKVNVTTYNSEEYYCKYRVNATVAWGKLYRKECFEKLRFPIGKIHEDEFIIYRILFSQQNVSYVEEKLYAYYVNTDGIMNSQWSMRRLDAIDAIEEQIFFFKKNRYKMAWLCSCKAYCDSLSIAIINMIKYKVEKRKVSIYRNKLKKMLLFNGKKLGIGFKQECYWYYDCAFPKIMSIFWRVKK